MRQVKRLSLVVLLLIISFTFSGCEFDALELFEIGEVATEGEAVIATEEGIAMRYAATAEELQSVQFAVANQETRSLLFENMRLEKVAGDNPQLFVEGMSKPVGELINESEIKFANGAVYRVSTHDFAAIQDGIAVRASASNSSQVVTSLSHGNLVVKLGDVGGGWYRIMMMKKNVITYGFIQNDLLIPIMALAASKSNSNEQHPAYTYLQLRNGIIKFPDEEVVKKDLIGKSIHHWQFESLDEIKSLAFCDHDLLTGDLSYSLTALISLESENTGEKGTARIMITYNVIGDKWHFTSVSEQNFQKIQESTGNSSEEYNPEFTNEYTQTNPDIVTENNTIKSHGELSVQLSNHSPFGITVDSKTFRKIGTSQTIGDIPPGQHFLRIFSYACNIAGNRCPRLLYQGYIQISDKSFTYLTLNIETGQIYTN